MSEAPDETAELTDDALVIDTAADTDTQPEPSAEDRAMAMGWTPKGQFKGDPEKWVDAETFVKRGEEFLPFLKANNRRLEQALDRQSKETAKLKSTLESFADHHSKTAQREYARAMSDIQARIDQAAANGDVQGVRDGTDELVDLTKQAADPAPDKQQANPDFEAWRAENAWFGTDKALTAAFNAICEDVHAEGYTSPKAGLKEAFSRLKDEFPAKFEKPRNPNRELPGAVEGSGAPRRTNGKSYSDLPSDAKAVCDDFVKRVPGFTREKYAKDFFGQ